jgi:hypothetical protein
MRGGPAQRRGAHALSARPSRRIQTLCMRRVLLTTSRPCFWSAPLFEVASLCVCVCVCVCVGMARRGAAPPRALCPYPAWPLYFPDTGTVRGCAGVRVRGCDGGIYFLGLMRPSGKGHGHRRVRPRQPACAVCAPVRRLHSAHTRPAAKGTARARACSPTTSVGPDARVGGEARSRTWRSTTRSRWTIVSWWSRAATRASPSGCARTLLGHSRR